MAKSVERLIGSIPPAKLEEIVNKALEKDREVRYQHASDLRADLKRLKRDRDSARSTGRCIRRDMRRPAVVPERTPGARIERSGVTGRLGDIHNAVDHERRCLKLVQVVNLVHPNRFQVRDVLGVDLVQRRIAIAPVVAGVSQPVARLTFRVSNPFRSDLRHERE